MEVVLTGGKERQGPLLFIFTQELLVLRENMMVQIVLNIGLDVTKSLVVFSIRQHHHPALSASIPKKPFILGLLAHKLVQK
jgi:hypothetical protein